MHVTVATEAHFSRDPNGSIRSDTGGRAYAFWTRYLNVFESITVLARVSDSSHSEGQIVEGAGVTVKAIPGYSGMVGTLKAVPRTKKVVLEACVAHDMAFIARVPSPIGGMMAAHLSRQGRAFGLEVVGDPEGVAQSGLVKGLLKPIFAKVSFFAMRRQCARASAVSYVTKGQLQTKYPALRAQFVTNYSSVELPDAAFAKRVHDEPTEGKSIILIAVGSQDATYKGHDLLIEAVSKLRQRKLDVEVRLLGDGRLQPTLRSLAEDLKISEHVTFVGRLEAGEPIRKELDRSDFFVMPSLTEGLPRALIEAMARSLPCIATDVGGIPELLPKSDMVSPGSVDQLTDALGAVISDFARAKEMSERNFETAREYHEAVLVQRRNKFYQELTKI